MNILKILRTQDCVYWGPESVDRKGRNVFPEPVDCKCRWVDDNQLFMQKDGTQGMSRAFVDLDLVPAIDGVLRKGKIADLPDSVKPAANGGIWNPFKIPGSWKVRGTPRVPKVRAKDDDDPNKTLMRAVL